MGNRLIMLVRGPAKVASGHCGLDQIDRTAELAIQMQEWWPGMGLQRPDHLHGISWSVVKTVEQSRHGTAGCVVGICTVAGSAHALKFGDKVAGTTVDGLTRERAR